VGRFAETRLVGRTAGESIVTGVIRGLLIMAPREDIRVIPVIVFCREQTTAVLRLGDRSSGRREDYSTSRILRSAH
jgi:hypothetical protein